MTAVFKKVRGGYVGFVEKLPGANTQGRTLAETRTNLKEAVTLVLAANLTLAEEFLFEPRSSKYFLGSLSNASAQPFAQK